MTRTTGEPPRLAERWLQRRLDGATAEFVLGDLAEEFRRRRAAGRPAALWYWSQALRSGWALRARRGTRRGPGVWRATVNGWWQELRSACRGFERQPGLATVITLTLALAIGANSAIFSVVDAVLLRPLPYPQPDRLVGVWERDARGELANGTPANFLDWQREAKGFLRLAASASVTLDLTGAGPPQRLEGASVSASFFDVLGAPMTLGRGFSEDEDVPGAPDVVVISEGLWRRGFGADPSVLGRRLMLNDEAHTVVGVAPRRFHFPEPDVDAWVPFAFGPERRALREAHYLDVVGRIAEGVDRREAQAGIDTIAAQLAEAHPETNAGESALLVGLHEQLVGASRDVLLLLYGVVVIVLAVACANVANMLLARARSRDAEMAVRTALGASRLRLLRLSLTEGLLLAGLGSALGLVGAAFAVRALRSLTALGVPRLHDVQLDLRVAGYLAVAGMATGIAFSLAPALGSRVGMPALRGGGRLSRSAPGARLQTLLAVTQAALAVVCVVGAGLLLASFARLSRVDTGFDPRNVLTLDVAPRSERYADPAAQRSFYDALLERVTVLPGVEKAGVASFLPLTFGGGTISLGVEWRPELEERAEGEGLYVAYRVVSPDFFDALRIPLLRGAGFDALAIRSNPYVAVVDEAAVRQYFLGDDPLGRRVKLFSSDSNAEWLEVVGVVGSTRHLALGRAPHPTIYVPYTQPHGRWVAPRALALRTSGDPAAAIPAVRAVLAELDPDLPVSAVRTFTEVVAAAIAPDRVIAILVAAFGALALAVASVGLYGVLSFLVSNRRLELGVRMAVGAQPRDLMNLVLRRGLGLLAAGFAVGGGAALALSRSLRSLLHEVQPTEPGAWAAALAAVLAAGLAACYWPARRATRVDPIITLRGE